MITNLTPPPESYEKITGLVENFKNNFYNVKNWSEEDTKVHYITPFFEALGWDVSNREGNVDSFKEVRFETNVKVKSSTKSADYSFYLGKLLFHVEAKKPQVYIKEEMDPSFQIRSYGWSSGCVLGVLTDFEELAIYRCSKKPFSTDKAHVERAYYYKYHEYLDHWNGIYGLLSKPAVKKGALEKFAEDQQIGKGATSVDKEFLKTIEGWRKTLATHIARKNNIGEIELNYAVQKIIDRLIFLRICEDRGIENSEQLRNISQKPDIYEELVKLFHLADDKYNSGLFHFKKEPGRVEAFDRVTPELTVEDKVIKPHESKYYPLILSSGKNKFIESTK